MKRRRPVRSHLIRELRRVSSAEARRSDPPGPLSLESPIPPDIIADAYVEHARRLAADARAARRCLQRMFGMERGL